MKSSKVLEMLNQNRIEELKTELQDEIYTESLKSKPNAKKRYTAMKKYFTYVSSVREALTKPATIEFQGKQYTAFTNGYSLVLTKESCGEMKMFNDEFGNYPDVTRLIDFTGNEGRIDFGSVIAEAKSQGYKLKKSEVTSNSYLMHYDGAYYRIGLIDSTFGVIDDGEPASVFHVPGDYRSKLVINNALGVCVIMPLNIESVTEDLVIIEVNEKKGEN
jgi:hypothetical protein